MKRAVIITLLFFAGPAMGQVALHGDQAANEAAQRWYQDHAEQSRWEMAQNMSQMGNRNNAIPAHLLVIPQAWWTDQGNPEIACYHYDNGPYRDRLIDWCLAKVRDAK